MVSHSVETKPGCLWCCLPTNGKRLSYYKIFLLFVQEEEKPCALGEGQQVSLPPGQLSQEGWCPFELHCNLHVQKQKLQKERFSCSWRFVYTEKLLQNKTVGNLRHDTDSTLTFQMDISFALPGLVVASGPCLCW